MNEDVVIDMGSYTTKAGLCKDLSKPDPSEPSVVMPTTVRVIQNAQDTSGSVSKMSGFVNTVDRARIQSWEQVEAILYHILGNRLGWGRGAEGNILWVDSVRSTKEDRENIAQIVFESFNAKGLYIADSAVLALYSVGKVTGVAVDMGHGALTVTPVESGRVYYPGRERIGLGGQDLDGVVARLLSDAGVEVSQRGRGDQSTTLRAIKAACMRVCATPSEVDSMRERDAKKEYKLPDGQVVQIPEYVGGLLGEALIRPSVVGLPGPGMAEAIHTCIAAHPDFHTRRLLADGVFLYGGGSAVEGLRERLAGALHEAAHSKTGCEVLPWPEYMPKGGQAHAAFHGGAILAKAMAAQATQASDAGTGSAQPLTAERNLWVTRQEYIDYGPTIVRARCC